ncbi:MAG TPA: hypothetical protein VHQ02_12720 [Usitatibacter sp.]|jgi:hypothetical protein|nr:hypothetical protein [Usitatibacter sp.]
MASRRFLPLAGAACAGFFAFAANSGLAQTLYKLIDRNGKVTYSQEAPKDFDGKVIRIDIDPNRNSATLGVPPPTPPGAQPPEAAPEAAKRVAQARERLAAARKALAEAREHPAEDETRFVGKVGGGARSIPTEAYQERLAGLERAVKEAEDELAKAQEGK